MSTIYDIADRVGLSPSTVARALSGKGYCSEKNKIKILQAAQEMHYVPVQAAKSLKNKITKKVMLCIPDILNPYYFSMINGVNQVLEEHGYYTILVYTNHDPQRELKLVESLKERFVDGLIMVSFDFSKALLEAIERTGMPTVLTNYYNDPSLEAKVDFVYVDHTRATYIATEHLIASGYREIAILGGDITEQTGRERLEGYRLALAEHKLPYDERLVIQADYTLQGALRAVDAYLAGGGRFSALVSCNDLMGIGCLNACAKAGLRPPDDFAIVTLDNTDYCLCTTPRLTSLNMMQDEIGRNAALFLMEQIHNERDYFKTIKLTPQLVARDSVRKL